MFWKLRAMEGGRRSKEVSPETARWRKASSLGKGHAEPQQREAEPVLLSLHS